MVFGMRRGIRRDPSEITAYGVGQHRNIMHLVLFFRNDHKIWLLILHTGDTIPSYNGETP